MKEKKKSMRTYAVYGNTAAAAAELILAEDRKRHFTVIAGGKEQNGDCGMATELTGMGGVVSALLGLLETCLIFLGLRLSFSFIPVFSVAVLWASLSILTGAFLELLLSIFGQSVYTDIRLQAEPYDRSGKRR
ncbi:MAG: hypothetical protein ACLU6H_07695 [Lachnospiraceae bacterium]